MMNTQSFIVNARKLHGDKYDYSKVKCSTRDEEVVIICPIHGKFKQRARAHAMIGHGCFKCSRKVIAEATRLNIKDAICRAKKIHGSKYDYSKVKYKSVTDKVTIICKKHGEFKQKFNYHYSGGGCKKCANDRATESIRYTKDEFIKLARKLHKNKYNYSSVIYKNGRTPVCIKCSVHGKFYQTPHSHTIGRGCSKCGIENRVKKTTNTKEHFIRAARKIHGNIYDYSDSVYVNSKVKLKISCPIHGEFWQSPNAHTRGTKCPTCAKFEKTSRGETEFLNHVGIPEKQRQITILNYIVDGIDHENKTIYEYLGDYWHGNPKRFPKNKKIHGGRLTCAQVFNDTFKRLKNLKKLGYRIKYIWESDWKSWKKTQSKKIPIKNFL